MSVDILMPALSPTMEEGTLAKWLKAEGDRIAAGDVIAEIETDKATMEVEAVDEGTLAKILVPEGTEGVKVNAVIAVLAEEGEDASNVEAKGSDTSANGSVAENGETAQTSSRDDAAPEKPSSDIASDPEAGCASGLRATQGAGS